MEGLAPPLKVAIELYFGLLNGKSVREILKEEVFSEHSDFSILLKAWYLRREQGLEVEALVQNISSAYRRNLISLIDQGLKGASIAAELGEFIEITKKVCLEQIDEEVRKLPYLGLIPLLFFMFPSLLILILSPIFHQLSEGLK